MAIQEKQLKRTVTNGVASIVEQATERTPQEPITLLIDPRLLTSAIDLGDQREDDDKPSFTPAIEEGYVDEIVSPPPETVLMSSESTASISFVTF